MATASAPAFGGVVVSSPSNRCCSRNNSSGSVAPILSSSLSPCFQKSRLSSCLPGVTRIHGGSCTRWAKLDHSGKFFAERWRWTTKIDRRGVGWNARAQVEAGSYNMVAKEMERVAAKEALILSIKDAGGLRGLSDPAANAKAKIDVNEKILNLERLNPTPRPTTSPILEGLWQFEWASAESPGIVAAKTILGRFPPALASINSLTILILDERALARGFLKIFNTLESSFTLVSKLTVEGPLRLKEEYVEGVFSTPTVREGSIPSQLKGVVDQLVATIERFPNFIKEVVNGGVKFSLTGTFSRELLISYLDEEILVARDKEGIPDVLLRLESPITDNSNGVIVPEYLS